MTKKVVRYRLERYQWEDEKAQAKQKRKTTIIIVGLCVLCSALGFGIGKFSNGIVLNSSGEMSKLEETYHLLLDRFYFKDDVENMEQALLDGALQGMVSATGDLHTNYLTVEQAQSYSTSMEGSIVGIGVSMFTLDEGVYMVSDVIKGSSAEAAGILPGDQIYRVNGEDVKNMTLDEVGNKVQGEEGTKVVVEFLRGQEVLSFEMKRKKVLTTVYSSIHQGVGVMKLTNFAQTSGEEVETHLKDLKAAGIQNLVVDLRDNTGGFLSSAVHIISCFVEDKDVVLFKSSELNDKTEEYTRLKEVGYYDFDKIVLLVNGNSASASEVMVSSLKALYPDKCTVVGENTYGKGTVQITLPYTDGSMLKYTMAQWLSKDGESFNEVGIKPDKEVIQPLAFFSGVPVLEEDEEYQPDSVSAIAAAVQSYLKFLGYPCDREDGYFSNASSEALKQFQLDNGLTADGIIRNENVKSLYSKCLYYYRTQPEAYDIQLIEGIKLLK